MFYAITILLWLRQLTTFLTNKTTVERFGRKKQSRSNSVADNQSTTTSVQAERIINSIGTRKQFTGPFRCCKNLGAFLLNTFEADCCTDDRNVGFQEDIIQQLYELIKYNHGYEDDWGMVIE